MRSFLQHIVDDADKSLLKESCYVFPSRRACAYFNKLLQDKFANEVTWGPEVLSIEEFIQKHSGFIVIDEIKLILLLFEEYKKEYSEQDFETFYSWGQTLLHDFDEIDRNLVDGELLYKNLQEIKDVDATFGFSEEALNALKSFQKVIDTSKNGSLAKSFSNTWKLAGRVYFSFKEKLLANGIAYNGLCYRQLAELLDKNSSYLTYRNVVFAGFNALSKAEETIIDNLLKVGLGEVYLDADRYYLDNDNEEAGFFLRKFRKKWRNNESVHWIISDGFSQPKTITITGASQNTAQALVASIHVEDYLNKEPPTAIALADESLLMNVLYALPANEDNLNITMGYPVYSSSTGSFVLSYFRLQAGLVANSSGQVFYLTEAIHDFLEQPLVSYLVSNISSKLRSSKSQYTGWKRISTLILEEENHNDLINSVLSPRKHISEVVESLKTIILQLYQVRKDMDTGKNILEERITYTVVKYLDSLLNSVSSTSLKLNVSDYARLVNDSIKQLKAPFTGEPLTVMQIMGFLETRALDFENLIILSVNEDILPAGETTKTYIPFGVRKAFQLPTFLEHGSIYAYHFFRLLQRAKNIVLVYNKKLSVTGGGEKSRFILQLLDRFSEKEGPIKVIDESLFLETGRHVNISNQFPIQKTGWVKDKLEEHMNSFMPDKPLSPTSLIDYITCSLKYYFARILKIRQDEDPQAGIDARVFGNILHELMELAYKPWIGKEISSENLKEIKKDIPKLAKQAFSEYIGSSGNTKQLSGEIEFTKHVIESIAARIVQNDIQDAPITILDLESKLIPLTHNIKLVSGKQIPIGGKIDRLDQVQINDDTCVRVLDYKTGKVDLKSPTFRRKPVSDEEYIETHFTDHKFKSGFQLLFYALIYKRSNLDSNVNAGIIGAKNLINGIEYLRDENQALTLSQLNIFEDSLVKVVEELSDISIPFDQTDDLDRCEYCEFKSICSR